MIDGKGETGKHGDEDAAFPWGAFSVCPDRPVDDRVANPILHFHIAHDRSITSFRKRENRKDKSHGIETRGNEQDLRGDKELVLYVHEMFRELNRCKNRSQFSTGQGRVKRS